jgi:streptomycin 6-kinase
MGRRSGIAPRSWRRPSCGTGTLPCACSVAPAGALLEERAVPGDDISGLDDEQATAVALEVATRIWRPATRPFRPVEPEIHHWLDRAEREGSKLVPLARDLYAKLEPRVDPVVHGDFQHHNILRHGARFVAIDPKPYLAEREYAVASFLWNPLGNRLEDRARTGRRIVAFVGLGLDDFRICAWTVIRAPTSAASLTTPSASARCSIRQAAFDSNRTAERKRMRSSALRNRASLHASG